MQIQLTPTQRMAEAVLGTDLGEYVREKRQARPRWSWPLIAEQLAIDTDGKVKITGQALWQWYSHDEKATA